MRLFFVYNAKSFAAITKKIDKEVREMQLSEKYFD